MEDWIGKSDYVLVVFSSGYGEPNSLPGVAGKGKGSIFEYRLIRQHIYDNNGENNKFIPVILSESDIEYVKIYMKGYTIFNVGIESQLSALIRLLKFGPSSSIGGIGDLTLGRADSFVSKGYSEKVIPLKTKGDIAGTVASLVDKNSSLYRADHADYGDIYELNSSFFVRVIGEFMDRFKEIDGLRHMHISKVFEQIVISPKINDFDITCLRAVRDSSKFTSSDRSLLVGALSLSSIANSGDGRIGLLLDFLGDFEEDVWQRALVGLVLSLQSEDRIARLSQKEARRIEVLRSYPQIYQHVLYISYILTNRRYNISNTLDSIPRRLIEFFFNDISASTGYIFNDNDYEDILDYMAENELNPAGLDFGISGFFSRMSSWFLDFSSDSGIVRGLVSDRPNDKVLRRLVEGLASNQAIENIDKHLMLLNYSDLDLSDIEYIETFDYDYYKKRRPWLDIK